MDPKRATPRHIIIKMPKVIKNKLKTPRQTTRTGTESQKWRSHAVLSVRREREQGERYRE